MTYFWPKKKTMPRFSFYFINLFAVALLLFVTGCATPVQNYQPESIAISEPPLNSTSTSQVGDNMLNQGKYQVQEVLYLATSQKVSWAYELSAGNFKKMGEDEAGEFFLPGAGQDGGTIQKAAIADPWKAVMLKKVQPNLCVVTAFNVAACTNSQGLERKKQQVLTQDAFQQTLIYSGRVGNKINVGYREFSNNLARPAFNNNVEYDLSESKLIGYKGAQIEVLEATNQMIRYRVLKNFNPASR